MNILVFSWRDPRHPLAGGAEQVMHEHMKGWVEAGHDVTLFASHFKGGEREENLGGVKIIKRGFQFGGVHIQGSLYYLFDKHKKFNLVVDQFHGISFFTPLYVRVPKLAVIQEVAKEVWLMNHLPKPFNWIVGLFGYLTEPLFFLFYKNVHFMTGSESAKQDIVNFGIPAKNITVVPHGVILPKLKIKSGKLKIKTIVFLGALTRDKGIEDAIKAFSLINKRKKEWQYWVIGKGGKEYIDFLLKLCRKLKIEGKVKFWGFVSQSKKFELLARAHIMVNPSVREGWGLVNIEANAMGTPVVAYKSPGLVDSVKNGVSGMLCKENSPASLAESVLSILGSPILYEKLRKGSVDWSSTFSWDKSRKKSLNLIESMVKK